MRSIATCLLLICALASLGCVWRNLVPSAFRHAFEPTPRDPKGGDELGFFGKLSYRMQGRMLGSQIKPGMSHEDVDAILPNLWADRGQFFDWGSSMTDRVYGVTLSIGSLSDGLRLTGLSFEPFFDEPYWRTEVRGFFGKLSYRMQGRVLRGRLTQGMSIEEVDQIVPLKWRECIGSLGLLQMTNRKYGLSFTFDQNQGTLTDVRFLPPFDE